MNPRTQKALSSIVFVVFFTVFGVFFGAFVATKVLPQSGMGWDQLADMLGGMMLGFVIALPMSIVISVKQQPRKLYTASFAAALGTASLIVLARMMS